MRCLFFPSKVLPHLYCRFSPDLCSYVTMLSAYINASDTEGAEKFFLRIKRDGFESNVVTYGTVMKGYANFNNLEKLMKVYAEMRMQGIKANQTIFTTIMDAYGKNEDFGSAVIWFKEMVSSGVPDDQKAKNILLSLAKTTEEEKEAKELVGNTTQGLVGEMSDSLDDANRSILVHNFVSLGQQLNELLLTNVSVKSNSTLMGCDNVDDEDNEVDDDDVDDDDGGGGGGGGDLDYISFKEKNEHSALTNGINLHNVEDVSSAESDSLYVK